MADKCSFCGREIELGTGKSLVKKDGTLFNFCSTKCEKNLLKLKRKPIKVPWTHAYRKFKGKLTKAEEVKEVEAEAEKAKEASKAKPKAPQFKEESKAAEETEEKKPDKKEEKKAEVKSEKKDKPAEKK